MVDRRLVVTEASPAVDGIRHFKVGGSIEVDRICLVRQCVSPDRWRVCCLNTSDHFCITHIDAWVGDRWKTWYNLNNNHVGGLHYLQESDLAPFKFALDHWGDRHRLVGQRQPKPRHTHGWADRVSRLPEPEERQEIDKLLGHRIFVRDLGDEGE